MPPVGFEPTISAGERPQTHALDRAATGTGLDAGTYVNSNSRISNCQRILLSKKKFNFPDFLHIRTVRRPNQSG